MNIFETMFLTIIWSKLLERINATSKTLESPTLNLISGVQLLESIVTFIDEFREKFDELEHKTKLMTGNDAQYKDETKRTKKERCLKTKPEKMKLN